MRFRLSKPTPAFAVAVTALLVSLGGTSYAVTQIGSEDIKNGSVQSVDVKDGSLRGNDIENGSLRGPDIANGSLTDNDFKEGTLLKGAKGDKGDKGEPGTNGAPGTNGTNGTNGAAGAQGVATRWALIDETGAIVDSSGGFSVLDAYVTNANVYINAGEDLTDNGVVVSIATQNLVDRNGTAGAEPNFAGEISGSRCQIAGAVECAPTSAKNVNSFVVTPRDSSGAVTTATNRIRFYVVITGDSSDYQPAAS